MIKHRPKPQAGRPNRGAPVVAPQHALAVGVVLFGNTLLQRSRLFQSLATAAAQSGHFAVRNLLLIDNAGSDAAREAEEAAALDLPVTTVSSRGNIGFGSAHNLLMREAFGAGADFYLCLNPDGFLHAAALTELSRFLELQPDPGLTDCRQIPAEHPKHYDAFTGRTPWCSGACLLVPRDVFEATGGFDEALFLYCEDVDFSWRARLAGFACRTASRAIFLHDASDRGASRSATEASLLSARYLGHKWRSPDFVALAENEIVEQGFAPSRSFLPDLSHLPCIDASPEALRGITEFRRTFHFCIPRWEA